MGNKAKKFNTRAASRRGLQNQIDVQEGEIAKLAKQVAQYQEQVSELEETNFDQWGQIKKLPKQANKKKDSKEAFMMQD